MNIKKVIAEHLLDDSALTEIVSDKIYRSRLPQGIKAPHVIIWLVDKERILNHDGYAYTEATVQISCYSHDPDEADEMAEIVRHSMESLPGVVDSFFDGESDIFEEATLIYHVACDYRISYHE
jgi:hypothetical protein